MLTFALGSAFTMQVKSAFPRRPGYTARSAAETSGGSKNINILIKFLDRQGKIQYLNAI